MSGFSLGGLMSGAQKGVQYDLEFLRAVAWAVKSKNVDALAALGEIAAANAKEIAGEAVTVSQAQVAALLFNPDPFQHSRQMFHDFTQKYPAAQKK